METHIVREKVGRIKGSCEDPPEEIGSNGADAAGGRGEESRDEIIAESEVFSPQGNRVHG